MRGAQAKGWGGRVRELWVGLCVVFVRHGCCVEFCVVEFLGVRDSQGLDG